MILRPLAAALLIAIGLLGFVGVQRDEPSGAMLEAQVAAPSASPAPVATPSPSPAPSPAATPLPPVLLAPGEKPKVWRRGSRDQKLVALTFDDGWNRTYLRRIVDILVREQVPATFFPVARAVERNPGTWRLIADAGFPIGNHSWNHADLSRKSVAKATADLNRATRAIERVTGRPIFPALRPTFGAYDRGLLTAAARARIVAVVMWDTDTRDWTGIRPAKVVSNATKARPGSIVVMHTDKANTVKALPKIIAALRKRGYTFVTVGQLLGIPGDVPAFAGQGPGRTPGSTIPS